jgi:hypothetical protein
MMRCDECQALLLDHLYGLLEPAESAAVEQHLGACAGCSGARAQAARVQGLLAQAARTQFPHIHFAAPSAEAEAVGTLPDPATANAAEPASSVAASPRRGKVWVRWAIAAGIALLVPALLLPLNSRSRDYEAAKAKADDAAARLADARAEIDRAWARQEAAENRAETRYTAAWNQTQSLLADWVKAEKAADAAEKDRPVAVTVARPQSVVAGAPNEFHVAIKARGNALEGKRVIAEVRGENGKVLHSQTIETARKDDSSTVRLPAEVWTRLKPRSELFLTVAAIDNKTSARTELVEPIRLFGPVYTTLLVTDKSSYRPGERLFFRSLTLDRVSFRPPDHEQVLHFTLRRADGSAVPGAELYGTTGVVRVADGSVEPVMGLDGAPLRGIGTGAIVLPADLADGDYVLTLTELSGPGGRAPAQAYPVRKLIGVRSGRPERFIKTIGFTAASFAPGRPVDAWAEVKSQDQRLEGVTARAVVTVDGKPLPLVRLTPQPVGPDGKPVPKTGPDGRVRIRFVLPKELPRGDVRLMVTFRTAEAEESVAKRVPITGRDILVEFFPEGGNLVAGVPNRVYVRATSADGKPVDVRGEVVAGGKVVAKVESPKDEDEPGVNRGLGSFIFTPQTNETYHFKLAGMAGREPFELPKVQPDGVAMTVPTPVIAAGEPITIRLRSAGKPRSLVVGAYIRGRLADTQRIEVKPEEAAEVKLITNRDPRGGVTRVTVFEDSADPKRDLVPVAERLVFRRPGEVLNLTASTGAPGTVFAPGSPVQLSIAATDEKGNPVPAIVWAAAVNAAVAPGAKDRSLPTHFLLAGEIQTPDDLEYADFLLTNHPKAAESLDLVLATQGWRRFVEQSSPAVVARQNRSGAELMVMSGAFAVATTRGTPEAEHQRLYQEYWPKYESLVKELDAAAADKAAAERSATDSATAELFSQYEARWQETAKLSDPANQAAESLAAARGWADVAAGFLAILAVVLAVLALLRPMRTAGVTPLLLAIIGAGGLAALMLSMASRPVATDQPCQPTPDELRKQARHENSQPGPAVKQPHESVRPPRLVKGANTNNGVVEPRVVSAMSNPAVRPLRAPGVGVFSVPAPSGLIPDSCLEGPRRSSPTVPSAQANPETERRILSAVAGFARDRAQPLAAPIEAVLPEPKGSSPVEDADSRIRESVPWAPPLVVREYAAPRPGLPSESLAGDTILWKPVIVLPGDGKAAVNFHVGKAPAGYQVIVAGHTLDGRIGSIRMIISVRPNSTAIPAPSK